MAKKANGLTPMMQQFFSLKAKHPDALMLFRCGDFYETYHEDAVIASKILGITLTRRSNSGQGEATEMAGFPHHALDTYLPKLIRAGKRVAICDQLEDPKLTKKLVKRGITELVTPGVAMSDTVLNYKE
ncbi:MAG: DNA mismatch repair protein MutS, partial [Prevotella sp.]|nr:DNA mismatch repair protein MutS [Prevotella sp.]